MKNFLLLLLPGLFFLSCNEDTMPISPEKPVKNSFINPAFTDFDIPFTTFSLQAERGDTLFSESGSILLFPSDAFIDKEGDVYKGQVTINYREILDPIDMFISGIPMGYDSAGTSYTFESAGMCEIYALSPEKDTLFVNPQSKPEINLVSKNKNDGFSLYFLDPEQENWVNKGGNIVTDLSEGVQKPTAIQTVSKFNTEIKPPVKPMKASGEKPVIVIAIVPGSVPELNEYNNLKFEVTEEEKNFDPEFSKIEWGNVELNKWQETGKYQVTFTKGQKQISYIVKPVFEGKDYDEALKIFEQKNKRYNEIKLERETNEKMIAERIQKENEAIEKENERIKRISSLIELRNQEIRAQNEKIERENRRIEEINAQIEEKNKRVEKIREQIREQIREKEQQIEQTAFQEGGSAMRGQILRTFQIERFGTWNCDQPILEQSLPVLAKYKDASGKDLDLSLVTIVYKDYNSLYTTTGNALPLFPNTPQMIFAVMGNKFVYLNYQEFEKYAISPTTKEISFKMKVHPDKITSRADIARIVGFREG